MAEDTERLLRVAPGGRVLHEFFAASGHMPLALALHTLLSQPPSTWWWAPGLIPALLGGLIQAWVLGRRAHQNQPPSFFASQIAAAVFTVAVLAVTGGAAGTDPRLVLVWGISLLAGIMAFLEPHLHGTWQDVVVICGHVIRAMIIPGVYMLFEPGGLPGFASEPSHLFLVVAAALVGSALGVAEIVHRRDRRRFQEVTDRLRQYSEMLLGRSMLTRALDRPDKLKPSRIQRAVLFADIRGFTRWSETRSPEEVLLMLDGLYTEVERACAGFKPVRTKHTADEVMMFFDDPLRAAQAALVLRDAAGWFLDPYGLHVGVGLHHGAVIEGLFGSPNTKAYDILGDTVNTAKRICDNAGPGKVIVSFTFFEAAGGKLRLAESQVAHAKGKSSTLVVAELLGVIQPEVHEL